MTQLFRRGLASVFRSPQKVQPQDGARLWYTSATRNLLQQTRAFEPPNPQVPKHYLQSRAYHCDFQSNQVFCHHQLTPRLVAWINPPRTRACNNQKRWQHYYRRTDSYTRFGQSKTTIWHWIQRPLFWVALGGGGALLYGFYASNLETVPVSGRRRFNIMGAEYEEWTAQQSYQKVMQQYRNHILPDWDPRVRAVRSVLQKLIPAAGMDDLKWEVYVVDDKEPNAFVIPGGKVFVYTGLLPIANTRSRLAAVLAHEIGHTLARHLAENASIAVAFYSPLIWTLTWLGVPDVLSLLGIDLFLRKPGSRDQEAEADYIGLMLMAQACFDPAEAIELWIRFQEEEKRLGGTLPQFLDTHPSSRNRMEKVLGWLPEARRKQEESDCQSTLGYASEFRKAFGGQRQW